MRDCDWSPVVWGPDGAFLPPPGGVYRMVPRGWTARCSIFVRAGARRGGRCLAPGGISLYAGVVTVRTVRGRTRQRAKTDRRCGGYCPVAAWLVGVNKKRGETRRARPMALPSTGNGSSHACPAASPQSVCASAGYKDSDPVLLVLVLPWLPSRTGHERVTTLLQHFRYPCLLAALNMRMRVLVRAA